MTSDSGEAVWKVPDDETYKGERILGIAEADPNLDGFIRAVILRREGVDLVAAQRIKHRAMKRHHLEEDDINEALVRIWERVKMEMSEDGETFGTEGWREQVRPITKDPGIRRVVSEALKQGVPVETLAGFNFDYFLAHIRQVWGITDKDELESIFDQHREAIRSSRDEGTSGEA